MKRSRQQPGRKCLPAFCSRHSSSQPNRRALRPALLHMLWSEPNTRLSIRRSDKSRWTTAESSHVRQRKSSRHNGTGTRSFLLPGWARTHLGRCRCGFCRALSGRTHGTYLFWCIAIVGKRLPSYFKRGALLEGEVWPWIQREAATETSYRCRL